mmetsp:Transcript_181/g.390  ORF Transcript_181/g.390 Transcript_181/m.390 type:complete len:315 (+) Transcript_181:64-1008(+)|eukprot:CAMPEP_0171070306 /NCGR_PEP_ID=MMETSP0766_2-20121228/9658_1 /TAXON_ID=439317 /ORGANISM="Gambierdiscus australes, Strain CAWD 149" /LENGTH=314 /DNA_ID=CAMNT_0011526759 /DNA_START=58 /DNA_END=1002 /DNA_ORIENTATION=+
MKRVCGPSAAELSEANAGALLERVLSLFEPRKNQHEGPEGDAEEEAGIPVARTCPRARTQAGASDQGVHSHRRCSRGRAVLLQGQAPLGGEASASSQQAPGAVPLSKSARELQESLREFKALLDEKGEDADPALKARVRELTEQLAMLFLDSSTKVVSRDSRREVPSSSSRTELGEGPAGTVKLHVDASMLTGSVGTFRDAQVDFEERQVVVRAVDRGGRTWTLRSAQLPGPILADESRFQICKTGKDLSITLKKANADDIWHQGEIKLSEEEGFHRPARDRKHQHQASSDPGTTARHRKKDTVDYIKLGETFI